jgi:hypothetical protein
MPLAPEESTQTRTIGRLVGLAGVAVLALGVVAVAAIVTVGSLERGTTPTPTPTSVAASPSTLAPTSVVLARAPSDPIVPASALVPDTDAGVAIDAGAPPPDAWVAPRDTGAPRARVARARGSLSVICPSLSVTVCVRGHCAATPTRFDDVPEGLVVVHIEGTNGRTATQQVQVRAHDTARVVVTPP